MQETIYYRDKSILITSTRAVINGQTFAPGHVGAVALRESKQYGNAHIYFYPFGLMLLLGGGGGMLGQDNLMNVMSMLIAMSGAAMLLAARLMSKKIIYSARLSTSSGEVNAIASPDRERVAKVVHALSQMITARV